MFRKFLFFFFVFLVFLVFVFGGTGEGEIAFFDNLDVYAAKVFKVMRKQEQARIAELDAEKANFEAIQAHADVVSSS